MNQAGGKRERLDLIGLMQKAPPVKELPDFNREWLDQLPRQVIDPSRLSKKSQIPIARPYLLAFAATLPIFLGVFAYFVRSAYTGGVAPSSQATSEQRSMMRALVFYADGQVFVIRGDSKNRLFVGDTLTAGDRIETVRGSAGLAFGTGLHVTITPSTTVDLEQFFNREGDRTAEVSLNLNEGSLIARIKKLEAGSSFQIKTPTAVAGVRGTTFLVKSSGGVTDVVTLEGSVELISVQSGGSIILNAGEAGNATRELDPVHVTPEKREIDLLKKNENLILREKDIVNPPVLEAVSRMKALKSEEFQGVYGRDPEIILLKDGRVYKGIVASQTGDLLLVHSTEGVHLIRAGEIKEIRYVEVP